MFDLGWIDVCPTVIGGWAILYPCPPNCRGEGVDRGHLSVVGANSERVDMTPYHRQPIEKVYGQAVVDMIDRHFPRADP